VNTEDRDAAWVDYAEEDWETTRYASERHEGFNAGWAAAQELLREAGERAWEQGYDAAVEDEPGDSFAHKNPYKEDNR
jgi:hypothetical protein